MKQVCQVVINADDFGRSAGINAAVLRAHEEGILTSASLMVAGDMAEEAIAIARTHPRLAVGLHVVVVAGRAVMPPTRISHLVGSSGYFLSDPFAAGLRYFFDPVAREQLALELRAQFERFTATGLPLAHVDGHVNMHLHPTVLKLIVPLAREFGARRIRLPRDDLWLSLRLDKKRVLEKVLWAGVYALLCRWSLRTIRRASLQVTERVYGLLQTGDMHEDYVMGVLKRLSVSSAELYFHPAAAPPYEKDGPNPGDLRTLLSPGLSRIMTEHYLQPVGILDKQDTMEGRKNNAGR